MQWVMCTVCLRPVYVFLLLSLTEYGEGISTSNSDVGNFACCAQLSHKPENSHHHPDLLKNDYPFPEYSG